MITTIVVAVVAVTLASATYYAPRATANLILRVETGAGFPRPHWPHLRQHVSVNKVIGFVGVLGVLPLLAGVVRLCVRYYAPRQLRTPLITDPGPGPDAVAFLVGLLVVVLTAAALLERTARTEARR
jgi:hypothetical protein